MMIFLFKAKKGGEVMKGKRLILFLSLMAITVIVVSCAPKTFVKTMSPGWSAIEIREGITYEVAWESVVDLIARKLDIEILSREDGYLRTGWLYSWTGKLTEVYKVRAVVKFSPNKKVVEIKSEAQYFTKGTCFTFGAGWVMGTDERLTTTLKTDIMGKVGRTTR